MDAPPASVETSAGSESSTKDCWVVGMERSVSLTDEYEGGPLHRPRPRRRGRSSMLVTAFAFSFVGVLLPLENLAVAAAASDGRASFDDGNNGDLHHAYGGGGSIRTVEESATDATFLATNTQTPHYEPKYDEGETIDHSGEPRRIDLTDASEFDGPIAIEDAPTRTTGRWRGRTAETWEDSPTLEAAGGSDVVATASGGRRAQASVFTVIDTIPHDTSAFTQGLTYHDGILYESTGLRGRSKIRKLDATTGDLLAERSIPSDKFGEGMTCVRGDTSDCDSLVHVTWTSRTGYVYDPTTLATLRTFTFSTRRNQGWGITYRPDFDDLVVSDGSEYLHFWESTYPFRETGRVEVKLNGQDVRNLNELEYVNGYILANVWKKDVVVRIDPRTGDVLQQYDFSTLWPPSARPSGTDVFNGMSVGEKGCAIYMTGKFWPNIYKVSIAGLGRHTDELLSSMAGGWITNGIIFDVVATKDVRIFGFDINLYSETADIEVYSKDGSSVDSEVDASDWTLIGAAEGVVSEGYRSRTPLPDCTLDWSVVVKSGETRSFYITTTDGEFVALNLGSGLGSRHSSNGDMGIVTGYAVQYNRNPFDRVFPNYVFNGHVLYSAE